MTREEEEEEEEGERRGRRREEREGGGGRKKGSILVFGGKMIGFIDKQNSTKSRFYQLCCFFLRLSLETG
jgi:hypothetical protein